jgi:hypothetical protein
MMPCLRRDVIPDIIENVCEEGLAYSIETVVPALTEFPPEKKVQLIVSASSGEKWHLDCEIRWSSVSSPWPLPQDYRTLGMGVRVIDPPENYREYVRTLQ